MAAAVRGNKKIPRERHIESQFYCTVKCRETNCRANCAVEESWCGDGRPRPSSRAQLDNYETVRRSRFSGAAVL
jgi:hypothetical protein